MSTTISRHGHFRCQTGSALNSREPWLKGTDMQVSSLNDAFRAMTKQHVASNGQNAGDDSFGMELAGMVGSPGEQGASQASSMSPTLKTAAMLRTADYMPAAETQNPPSLLLDVEDFKRLRADGSLREATPNIAEFRARTGVDFKAAAFYLGGAIGRSPDMRDWTAIMASDDPLAAVRRATGELLGPGEHAAQVAAELEDMGYRPAQGRDIVAQAGNFAVIDHGVSKAGQRLSLEIVDSNGHIGYPVYWDETSIRDAGKNFGISLAPLAELAEQLDAKGLKFMPWQMVPGTALGADLVGLASSDPTQEP